MENIFDQSPSQCRMEWGIRGVEEASNRGDIIIIVDVLSFSSAVINALHNGVIIYPFPRVGEINEFAKLVGGEVCILERARARELGLPSLSATSFNETHKGQKFILSSINGATCVKATTKSSIVLVGGLLNVFSVAEVANKIQRENNINITVIACGERWNNLNNETRDLRPSIEDYLGAGAILELLNGTKSQEAKVCINAYKNSKKEIEELITDSGSGRELLKMGFPEDVKFSCQIDLFKDVPLLVKDDLGQMYFKNYE
jgi:2-phosphosulfolactate phosphatase